MKTHYQIEILYEALYEPLCKQSGDVEMTIDEREIDCKKCLALMNYPQEACHDKE